MPSRGEKIFWCLKKLFSSQCWPKTANFNLSETETLVFALKKGNLYLQKRIDTNFLMVMLKKKNCDLALYSQISMTNKLQNEVMIFLIKDICELCLF